MNELNGSLTIGFLGAGKMARALASGLVSARPFFLGKLTATARTEATLTQFIEAVGQGHFESVSDNRALVTRSDVVILGIKPGQAAEVLPALKEVAEGRLFISLLAGIPIARLEALLGFGVRVIRAMPNTPALIGEGMTGYAGGGNVGEKDLILAQAILGAAGQTVQVKETDLDALTALSGSGPAYVYHFMQALIEGGVAEGLTPDIARSLAVQTVIGAARMVAQSSLSPLALADQVKSPGGTTLAGCQVLADQGWEATLRAAIAAARKRASELSRV